MDPGPETFYAATEDGWSLALHRYAPRGTPRRHPLLMVHGMAANALHFDLTERTSLARAAQARGFDVYVAELRGSGRSRAPAGRTHVQCEWGFADYAERDMPTLISAVLERTGAAALLGLGHSMGGMLLCCIGVGAPSELRAIAAIGAPLIEELSHGPRERRLLALIRGLTPAAHLTPTAQRRVPLRRLLGLTGRLAPLSARLTDVILLNPANCDPEALVRLVREAIDDVPVKLFAEIGRYMAGPRDSSPYAYETQLGRIAVPVLAVSGAVDRVAPAASVAALTARLRGPDVRYREMGTAAGDRVDYGHVDLLLGRNAPEELFPGVLDFLEEVD